MNKLYLIVPLVLTLAFSGIYVMHRKDAAVKKAAAAEVAAKTAAEADAKKAEAERQAREDADKRTAERVAEEKKKEEEKRAKWLAAGEQVEKDRLDYLAQAEKNQQELKALEDRLAALRVEKEKATQAQLDLDLSVEQARIAKRNAELEIQRLVEMTATRAGTTLTAPIVPAPAP